MRLISVFTAIFLAIMLTSCAAYKGKDGSNGHDGKDGIDGVGTQGNQGDPGTPGAPGAAGSPGANGANGHNALIKSAVIPFGDPECSGNGGYLVLGGTDTSDNGTLENSEVTLSSAICNGAQGIQGAPGVAPTPPQYTPTEVIEPCGHASSAYKEALLGLSGGGLFGSFSANSDALTVRNTLIPNGSYWDTDASKCVFSVSTDGSGNRDVVWNGSSGSGNTYPAGFAHYNASTQTWTVTY